MTLILPGLYFSSNLWLNMLSHFSESPLLLLSLLLGFLCWLFFCPPASLIVDNLLNSIFRFLFSPLSLFDDLFNIYGLKYHFSILKIFNLTSSALTNYFHLNFLSHMPPGILCNLCKLSISKNWFLPRACLTRIFKTLNLFIFNWRIIAL